MPTYGLRTVDVCDCRGFREMIRNSGGDKMAVIELTESEEKYFLKLPGIQEERAKSIKGYAWDWNHNRWVYPKKPEILDLLIAEFGDDENFSTTIATMKLPKREKLMSPFQLDMQLRIDNLEKRYQEFEKLRSDIVRNGIEDKDKLVLAQKELLALKEQLTSKEGIIADKDKQINRLKADNSTLEAQIQKLNDEKELENEPFVELKEILKQASAYDSEFCKIADQSKNQDALVHNIATTFEATLAKSLKLRPSKQLTISQLIYEACSKGIIDDATKHQAHQLRINRNFLFHHRGDKQGAIYHAKMMLVFYIAATMWPSLPKIDDSEEGQQV